VLNAFGLALALLLRALAVWNVHLPGTTIWLISVATATTAFAASRPLSLAG
jgi:hypothetical protein